MQCRALPNPLAFLALTAASLVPIWLVGHVPTQDGPSHLSNAFILRELGRPGSRLDEFYERRLEPIPNWTVSVLLIGLMSVIPPIAAGKVILAIEVAGFAWSYRWFLGAFEGKGRAPWLVPASAALLIGYHRGLLLGFSNYVLSLSLAWSLLGGAARRGPAFGPRDLAWAMPLLLLSYITHPLGLGIGLLGSAWFVADLRSTPRGLGWLLLSAMPVLGLSAWYLGSSGHVETSSGAAAWTWPPAWWTDSAGSPLSAGLHDLDSQLFGAYAGEGSPLGLLSLIFLATVAVSGLAEGKEGVSVGQSARRRAMTLGLLLATVHALLPEHLGARGGFLGVRLPPMFVLLGLAGLPKPRSRAIRRAVEVGALLLLGLQLALLTGYFRSESARIEEYTAAVSAIGEGRTIAAFGQEAGAETLVNPIEHAVDLYCLGSGNVDLGNYEAATNHFPVRFRGGSRTGFGDLASRRRAEVIVLWMEYPWRLPQLGPEYRELFARGRLRVLERWGPDRVGDVQGDPR